MLTMLNTSFKCPSQQYQWHYSVHLVRVKQQGKRVKRTVATGFTDHNRKTGTHRYHSSLIVHMKRITHAQTRNRE